MCFGSRWSSWTHDGTCSQSIPDSPSLSVFFSFPKSVPVFLSSSLFPLVFSSQSVFFHFFQSVPISPILSISSSFSQSVLVCPCLSVSFCSSQSTPVCSHREGKKQ